MASSNKALEVKASVTAAGKKIHPTQIKIMSAIGNMAQASVTYIHKSADANKSATNITAKDIFTAMGERQTKSFSDTPDNPDVTIQLKDAYSGTISFKGNVSSPNYSFSVGDVSLTEDVQPDYAAINCMDLSIYESTGPHDLDREASKKYPSNLAEFFAKVFNDLIEKGGKRLESQLKNMPEHKKAALTKQHKINQKVKKFVDELFSNSKDTIGWDGVAIPKRVKILKARVIETLKGKTGGGFLNNILRLADEFQCVYVPAMDKIGKLVNKKKLLTGGETLKLHPVSLSAHAGSVGMFPVRAVVVTHPDNSQATAVRSDADLDRKKSYNLAAMYPKEPAEGGTVLNVLGPQWLSYADYNIAKLNKTDDGKRKPLQKNKLTKDKAKGAKRVGTSLDESFENNEKLTEEWAEIIYYWQALGQAYAIINTELNLNVEVGKRYKIKGDSGNLFSGVLNSVTHTIYTSQKSSVTQTQLQFSHIIMGSATIPGID